MSLIVGGKTYKKTNKRQTTTKGVNEFCFFYHKLKCLSSLIFPIATAHILT
jgi:hypothetical protein